MEERKYIIYKHVRLDSLTTFYVGKGTVKRSRNYWDRNEYWQRIVKKSGYKIEIISKNLTNAEAYALEVKLIALYRRYGRCEANLTSGGDGAWTHSESTKQKLSVAGKGRPPPNKGKKTGVIPWNKGKIPSLHMQQVLAAARQRKKDMGLSAPNKGQPMSYEQKVKCSKAKACKPFQVIDIKTKSIVWEGLLQSECADTLGLSRGNLNMCLKNKRRYIRTYVVRYIDDVLSFEDKMRNLPQMQAFQVIESKT